MAIAPPFIDFCSIISLFNDHGRPMDKLYLLFSFMCLPIFWATVLAKLIPVIT